MATTRGAQKTVKTGDYIMPTNDDGGVVAGREKMLVNIGPERKGWLKRVADHAQDSDMTEVLKCVIDHAAAEDPESYAIKVEKWRLKTRLEDIEARERALQEEKQQLVNSLEAKGVSAA